MDDNEGDNLSGNKRFIFEEAMPTNNPANKYPPAKDTNESGLGLQYQKNKSATQGVTGQLYEAKLNALILHRMQNNTKVKEFYMGSNLDGIGDMDDICIRLIHEDCEKPLLILMQAKHKDNPEAGIRDKDLYYPKSDFYLPKNFSSLHKLKEKFDKKLKDDVMYSGDLDDYLAYFIFYTPAVSKYMSHDKIITPNSTTCIDVVKEIINSRTDGGNVFQLDYSEDDIKKITNDDATDREQNLAKKFYENLYFFTDQGKEDEVGRELEKEIANIQISDGTSSQLQVNPNAVFLNFYNSVFKWWLMQGKAYYLTKTNDFLNTTLSYFVNNGYLSMLSSNCVNHLDLYSIEFNEKSMNSAQKLLQSKIVISNSVLLTSIKLKQYLQKQKMRFSYLDYSYVIKMSDGEFDKLLSEIEKTEIETLVIIIDTSQQVINKRLQDITNKFRKNSVIVTEESQAVDLRNVDNNINVEKDYIRGLTDISNDENILEYKIIVQGKELCLNDIIDDNSKDIINAEILVTILKNERLELGRSLFNYKVEKCWFKRKVSNGKELFTFDTLNDLNDKETVVITAEAGMGKSSLLSQLAAKKKNSDPKTWIVRMHLQDYSDDFDKWQYNNTEIGLKETILLVCKTELTAEINKTLKFDLEITNNRLEVANATIQGSSLLLLKYIVHSFNEGNILYLFDGFDKMCPHYDKLVIKFIKNLVYKDFENFQAGPRVWITTRPCNIARRILRAEFGSPLALAPLTPLQQKEFYTSYWCANISKENLNINDPDKQHNIRKNIRHFFNNMSQTLRSASIHLEIMYETARDYVQSEYDCEDIGNIKICRLTYHPSEQLKKALHLSGIPLYMELYANHFAKYLIKNVLTAENKGKKQSSDTWRCDTFQFFESLHDTEFEKIFYEGKQPFNPDAIDRCERAKYKSNERHKQLAFYSLFHDVKDLEYYSKLFDYAKLVAEISKIKENVKNGKEKIGLIDSIHHGIPKFVHQAFAECYAVEFIIDLLKGCKNKPNEKKAIDFVINRVLVDNVGLMSVFDQKLKDDEKLSHQLSEKNNKQTIFKVLVKQNRDKNSLLTALDNGFEEIAKILVHSIEVITDIREIRRFFEFIKGDIFIYAASFGYNDLIKYVIYKIEKLDTSIIDNIIKTITAELNENKLEIDGYQMNTIVENLRDSGIVLHVTSRIQCLSEIESNIGEDNILYEDLGDLNT